MSKKIDVFKISHFFRLLILDEIDALESRKQTILYTIFEWPSIKGSKVVLVGVANALDLTDRMLPRLEANVSLKPTLMNFAPYSKQQILDIISKKLEQVRNVLFPQTSFTIAVIFSFYGVHGFQVDRPIFKIFLLYYRRISSTCLTLLLFSYWLEK